MQKEYFAGKVKEIVVETDIITYPKVIKNGWFKKTVEIISTTQEKHYAICSLLGADFLLKIPILDDEEYKMIKVGDSVSINLTFQYGYSCFHYEGRGALDMKTIDVCKEN